MKKLLTILVVLLSHFKEVMTSEMGAIYIPTNGTHDTRIRYAEKIKKLLRLKNNLRNTAGRDYEGDPKAGAVNIPVRDTEVSVGDYDVVAGGTLGTSATSYLQVLVDKNKYVNELVDSYEAEAVPDNLKAQRIDSAAYSLDRQAELDFIAELKTGTESSNTTALTTTTAYSSIVSEIGNLIELGVDPATIKVAISTDVETLLLTDQKYTNTASQIGAERAMKGVVNEIRGAEVYRTNNLGLINTTNNVEFIVYSSDFAQAGDAWKVLPDFFDIRDGKHIGSSALQGRWMYFNELTRSTTAIIKRDSAS